MLRRTLLLVLASAFCISQATAQKTATYRSAIVALTDDAELRSEFENGLVAKALAHDYDAVASHDFAPDITSVDDRRFLKTLRGHGVQAVLMLRPAAVGPGSSLESVRQSIPPKTFDSMRAFAKQVSPSAGNDVNVVVHMAIYVITDKDVEPISSGAVWLDEPVNDASQAVERLQDLIIANVDAARPAIRRHLGLPPLK